MATSVELNSPNSARRAALDLNSPKTVKGSPHWDQSSGGGNQHNDPSRIRRNDSGFALSDAAGPDDEAGGSDEAKQPASSVTIRSVSEEKGVSTRNLVLLPSTEAGGLSADSAGSCSAGAASQLAASASTPARLTAVSTAQSRAAVSQASPSVSPATSEGGAEVLPAGLAALLHQTDRSGKQQQAAGPVAPTAPATATTPAPLSAPRRGRGGVSSWFSAACCFSASAVQLDAAGPAGRRGSPFLQHAHGEQLRADVPSGSGQSRPPATPTVSASHTRKASADSRENSAIAGRVTPKVDSSISGSVGASAGASIPAGARGCGPTPALGSPVDRNDVHTISRMGSRRVGADASLSLPDTPSGVLSPTSHTARSSRDEQELYAKQRTPAWGSKHPTVIHVHYEAHRMTHQPGLGGGNRLVLGGKGRGGRGASRWGASSSQAYGTSMQHMSPVQAMEKEVEAIYTPTGAAVAKRVAFGPPAGHDEAVPCEHPKGRINNVRRASSTVGDGPLLGPLMELDTGKHCLVLDLDETLVHSSFRPVPNADYVLPVEIEGTTHYVYVIKRPGCEEFLAAVGDRYEVVLFTASLSKYADPLLDLLDPFNVIRARLFREACVFHEGSYVKDMSLLGRSPASTIIVDNSPASYLFQPENALPCDSFIDDPSDTELYSLADFLIRIAGVADVRQALQQWTSGSWAGGHDLAYVHPEVQPETSDEDTARGQLADRFQEVEDKPVDMRAGGGGASMSTIEAGSGGEPVARADGEVTPQTPTPVTGGGRKQKGSGAATDAKP